MLLLAVSAALAATVISLRDAPDSRVWAYVAPTRIVAADSRSLSTILAIRFRYGSEPRKQQARNHERKNIVKEEK